MGIAGVSLELGSSLVVRVWEEDEEYSRSFACNGSVGFWKKPRLLLDLGGLAAATAPLLLSRRPDCYWIPLSMLPSLFLALSPLNVSLIPSLWLSLLPLSDLSLVAD